MNTFCKEILNGLAFITGIIGFLNGEFIISSALFASTAVASNIIMNRKKSENQGKTRLPM
jgi:CheY-specific phosphatase CheX